jgi:hypothetical protein
VSLGGQQISVSLAASLGVGTIFAGSIKASESGFWLDAIAYADSATTPTVDNIVNKTRWGYGLRILFRAQQLDARFNLTFATIGAGVQLGLASASYEVQTIGLGPQALVAILGGLSQFGTLNGDTFHELNTTVIKNLSALIATPGNAFDARPLEVQVQFALELDPVLKARWEVFAMRRIRAGSNLNDALARAGTIGAMTSATIRTVYQEVAGNIPDAQQPPKSAQDQATTWLG